MNFFPLFNFPTEPTGSALAPENHLMATGRTLQKSFPSVSQLTLANWESVTLSLQELLATPVFQSG